MNAGSSPPPVSGRDRADRPGRHITFLKPEHCPETFDNGLHTDLIGLRCSDRLHTGIELAWTEVSAWIAESIAQLALGTLGSTSLPHPTAGREPITVTGIDPTTGHFFVEAGRRGKAETDALYVGLVCQNSNSAWQGMSGFYLPTCPQHDRTGRDTVARLRELMPQGTEFLSPLDLAPELRPHSGWFDDRLFTAARLPTGPLTEGWALGSLADVDFLQEQALLVRIGPITRGLQNLLFVQESADLAALDAVLAGEPGQGTESDIRVSYRRGPHAPLRQLAGAGHGHPVPTRQVHLKDRRVRTPLGWAVLANDRPEQRPFVTRSVRRSLEELRHGAPANYEPYPITAWTAPRLSERGAVEWSPLLRLSHRLAGLAAGMTDHD